MISRVLSFRYDSGNISNYTMLGTNKTYRYVDSFMV